MKMNKKIIANNLNQLIKEVSSDSENKTKWDLNPKKYPKRVIEAYENAEGTCPISYTDLDYENSLFLPCDEKDIQATAQDML
tara:strand:- start:134 stop:379 length:246 start_codon:yes stop_codon:yes gene_type:complete